MSRFYAHLVSMEVVVQELDGLDLSEGQKVHLAGLIDETVHHTVLNLVFSKLPYEDRVIFVGRLKESADDQTIMEFLKEKAADIEEEIRRVIDLLKEEFIKDIKEAQRNG